MKAKGRWDAGGGGGGWGAGGSWLGGSWKTCQWPGREEPSCQVPDGRETFTSWNLSFWLFTSVGIFPWIDTSSQKLRQNHWNWVWRLDTVTISSAFHAFMTIFNLCLCLLSSAQEKFSTSHFPHVGPLPTPILFCPLLFTFFVRGPEAY